MLDLTMGFYLILRIIGLLMNFKKRHEKTLVEGNLTEMGKLKSHPKN